MLVLDGNNSQKRSVFATEDRRTFHSDYFLPEEIVNTFHKRVKGLVPVAPVATAIEADIGLEADIEIAPNVAVMDVVAMQPDVDADLVADVAADVSTLYYCVYSH
jgi:hypothetical protein